MVEALEQNILQFPGMVDYSTREGRPPRKFKAKNKVTYQDYIVVLKSSPHATNRTEVSYSGDFPIKNVRFVFAGVSKTRDLKKDFREYFQKWKDETAGV